MSSGALTAVQRQAQDIQRVFGAVCLLLLASEVMPLLGWGRPPHLELIPQILTNCLLNSAFLGVFAVYLFLPWEPLEMVLVVGLGVVLEAWMMLVRSSYMGVYGRLLELGFGLGAAATGGFLWRLGLGPRQGRREVLLLLALGWTDVLFLVAGIWAHSVIVQGHPQVWDEYIVAYDRCFGCHPSFLVAGTVARSLWLTRLVQVVYFQLPLALTLSRLASFRHPERAYTNVQLSFVWLGLVGSALYNLYPAVGPSAHFGAAFPVAPPAALSAPALVVAPPDQPRNAMPSLHMAWTLAIFWSAWAVGPKARWAGGLYLGAMFPSAICVGTHYLMDLVVSFPLALFCQALAARPSPGRSGALGLGLVATLGSLLVLRDRSGLLLGYPILVVLGSLGLVALCCWGEARMRRDSLSEIAPQVPEGAFGNNSLDG